MVAKVTARLSQRAGSTLAGWRRLPEACYRQWLRVAAEESLRFGLLLEQNITWLADMNCAQTSGHTGTDVNDNGRMKLDAATAWAARAPSPC